MLRLGVVLIISSVIFSALRTVDSLDCFKCISVNQSGEGDVDCERGASYGVDRGPCRDGENIKACYKIIGVGLNNRMISHMARGCWKEHFKNGSRYFTGAGQDVVPFKQVGKADYNVIGMIYTCTTDLCNASNRLSNPGVLLATLGGFSLFLKMRLGLV